MVLGKKKTREIEKEIINVKGGACKEGCRYFKKFDVTLPPNGKDLSVIVDNAKVRVCCGALTRSEFEEKYCKVPKDAIKPSSCRLHMHRRRVERSR